MRKNKIGCLLFDVSPFLYIGYSSAVYMVGRKEGDDVQSMAIKIALNKIESCINFASAYCSAAKIFFVYDGYPASKLNSVAQYKQKRNHEGKQIRDAIEEQVKTLPGYHVSNSEEEADDIISTLKHKLSIKLAGKDYQFFIFTRDNDLLQLGDDRTLIYDPVVKGGVKDKQYVINKFGINSFKKIVLHKICFGDRSDNLEGVCKGKRRAPILSKIMSCRTYEDFYNLDEIKPHIQQAKKLEELIRLKNNCTFDLKKIC